jgi:ribosome biogenesis GTPase A
LLEEHKTVELLQTSDENLFFEIAALMLSANRKDGNKFIALDSFSPLVKKITSFEIHNQNDLYHLQYSIVQSISNDTTYAHIQQLHQSFEYLYHEKIIDEGQYNKLISLFDPEELNICEEIEVEDEINMDNTLSFKESKSALQELILDLKEVFHTQKFIDELEKTNAYMNNQKFSIGITGVMNAGKSTMLNALMGQEILGSAVVPETANLTIVKHDKHPSAKVFYWNKAEWDRIETSANEIESIKAFVQETHKVFGNTLHDMIQEESKSEQVDINNLAAFTSAETSGKKCNLVKYVELKSDLNFLSDGIEIVDTPGLDDPVIQREEITKEYLSQCDLMLHLMNVSQSATLKDVEFIIDALLYQNITKLLIVITRADTVSKEQLQEVIEYTKSSIETQLKSLNKDSQLDFILNSIEFIPISGKMALLHRTGKSQEALQAGYALEDTGILDIEEYLNETLFGKTSSKSELIIKAAKTQLIKTIEKQNKALNYEIILLSKSKEELETEMEEFQVKKAADEKIFDAMQSDINIYKNDAKEYIQSLQTFLDNELLELQSVIKQRVFSDVKYSFEKTKKRPTSNRIKTIIETAIKDGLIDIIRDYRYKFIKKSQNIGEISEQKYQEYGFTLGHKNDHFDALGFFQDDFKTGFLTTSNEVLISKIVNEVSKCKASKLNELDNAMSVYIKEEFQGIETSIKEKAVNISQQLIEAFFIQLNEPLLAFEQKLKNDEEILQNSLIQFEENEKNKDNITLQIHKKIKRLENITKELKS